MILFVTKYHQHLVTITVTGQGQSESYLFYTMSKPTAIY